MKCILTEIIEMFSDRKLTDPKTQAVESINCIRKKLLESFQFKTKEEMMDIAPKLAGVESVLNYLVDYVEDKNNYYKVGNEFGTHLDKLDINLPSTLLPKNFLGLIMFHRDFQVKKNSSINSVFVEIENGVVYLSLVVKTGNFFMGALDNIVFNLDLLNGGKNIQEILDEGSDCLSKQVTSLNLKEENSKLAKIVEYIFKILVYLESAEPNLQKTQRSTTNSKSYSKKLKFFRYNNPFDIINVGYDFHGRNFNCGKVDVRGHFRWQPHGEGRSKVKLIWINPFTKDYGVNNNGENHV